MRSSLILISMLFIGCNKATTGINMTGVYLQSGIQGSAYNKSLNTFREITIVGNNFVDYSTDGQCSVLTGGNVEFDSKKAYFTGIRVISVTDGSCELTTDYTPAGKIYTKTYRFFDKEEDQAIEYTLDKSSKRLGIRFATDLGTDLNLVFYKE